MFGGSVECDRCMRIPRRDRRSKFSPAKRAARVWRTDTAVGSHEKHEKTQKEKAMVATGKFDMRSIGTAAQPRRGADQVSILRQPRGRVDCRGVQAIPEGSQRVAGGQRSATSGTHSLIRPSTPDGVAANPSIPASVSACCSESQRPTNKSGAITGGKSFSQPTERSRKVGKFRVGKRIPEKPHTRQTPGSLFLPKIFLPPSPANASSAIHHQNPRFTNHLHAVHQRRRASRVLISLVHIRHPKALDSQATA
ncbi:hypothetical protein Enr13x_59800 [Stieleria neptunia]|uniref:Uncharacterized protein n=1 Tax=Stieleria neptunia TaxID=2527979 RepID=A0A518HYZ7_9BACT|nr:hypothetical protein Enr13x_59800 [Stieleria neptunia]